jgi:hypothetical protein
MMGMPLRVERYQKSETLTSAIFHGDLLSRFIDTFVAIPYNQTERNLNRSVFKGNPQWGVSERFGQQVAMGCGRGGDFPLLHPLARSPWCSG